MSQKDKVLGKSVSEKFRQYKMVINYKKFDYDRK